MSLSTHVEELQPKFGVAQLFGESKWKRVVRRIHDNTLLRPNELNPVTINHTKMDCVYKGNAYTYELFGLEEPPYTLGDTDSASK